ncbi:MAG: gliding motility-associated C-terminal domain-containing protein [Flavobacteriales bacterium]|nr:gliding motility-associated C-terminal domain-containing protein [Flavobacteriales bacterium]
MKNSSRSILLASCVSAVLPSAAQNCSFSIGQDTTLCHGQTILLAGPSGSLELEWQNGSHAQYINPISSGTYWCRATFPVPGQNAVVNGDFSAGDSGFSTDLEPGPGGSWGPLSLEGTYAVSTDAELVHFNFALCDDHTGGGNMFIANGSADPDASVWCQTVTVSPNTTYSFSAWLMSVRPENPAILDFTVNGQSLGDPLNASATTCVWSQFYALWESGTSTSADICITNLNLLGDGNDFALDDIAFTPLCTYTDSMEINILPAAPDVVVSGAEPICPGSLLTLEATLEPAGWPLNDVQFSWNTGAAGNSLVAATPGLFEATATGRCLNVSGYANIEADTCTTLLTMPNVFTPDGDGRNDFFRPIVIGEPSTFSMEIRNRWGQEVYRSASVGNGWDGRTQGTPVPNGTYFWVVNYGDVQEDGRTIARELSGHVTLLGIR